MLLLQVQEVVRLHVQETQNEFIILKSCLHLVMDSKIAAVKYGPPPVTAKKHPLTTSNMFIMSVCNFAYKYDDLLAIYLDKSKYEYIPFKEILLYGLFEAFKTIIIMFKNLYQDIFVRYMNKIYLFQNAVEGNSVSGLKLLLDLGISKDSVMYPSGTALHAATRTGSLEVANYLIEEENFSITEANSYGETPLYSAALGGRVEVVEHFIKNFPKKDRNKYIAFTMVQSACSDGNFEKLEKFLNSLDENECKIILNESVEFKDFLENAIDADIPNLIPMLVKHGANIYKKLSNGLSCMEYTFVYMDDRYSGTRPSCITASQDLLKIHKNNNDDLYALDDKGFSIVDHAFRISTQETFQFFIDEKINLLKTDSLGCNPFFHLCAADITYLKTITKCMETFQFDPKLEDNLGRTPAHYLIRNDLYHGQFEYFLNNGFVDPHIKDIFGYTLLDYALTRCDLELFNFHNYKDLSESFFPGNLKPARKLFSRNCRSCTEETVWRVNEKTVSILLQQGVKNLNENHCDPVLFAAYHTEKNILELFVNTYGRNCLQVSYKGRNILHFAVVNQNLYLVDFLIINGFDLIKNMREKFNDKYLVKSYEYEYTQKDTLKYILKNCENVNVYDQQGSKPLHLACLLSKPEILQLLINDEVVINEEDLRGSQPLHYATLLGNLEAVKFLIDKGAELNHKNKNKQTVLHTAVLHFDLNGFVLNIVPPKETINKYDVIKLLLDSGMDINSQDAVGQTPLHYACYQNNLGLIKLLVADQKPCFDVKDYKGFTPLDYVDLEHLASVKEIVQII